MSRKGNKKIVYEALRNERKAEQPLRRKNWSAKDKALDKFVSTVKPDTYWKQVGPDFERFIHFQNKPTANFDQYSIMNWTKSVFVDHDGDTLHRETPSRFYTEFGYSYTGSTAWSKTTKDIFDFWWNLAAEDKETW